VTRPDRPDVRSAPDEPWTRKQRWGIAVDRLPWPDRARSSTHVRLIWAATYATVRLEGWRAVREQPRQSQDAYAALAVVMARDIVMTDHLPHCLSCSAADWAFVLASDVTDDDKTTKGSSIPPGGAP
jgi:hypothetical protein